VLTWRNGVWRRIASQSSMDGVNDSRAADAHGNAGASFFRSRVQSQSHAWASFAVTGPQHRIFHSGDTGPFAGFVDIGTSMGRST
jgi:L-ascorbate metabolism protein UlaG (beta-lactamase superfamily)